MADHTPGPWDFAKSDLTPGRFSIYHNGPVAYCADAGQSGDGEANARLIAAAPELLAALQRLTHPNADDTDIEHALAVIAKAEGRG